MNKIKIAIMTLAFTGMVNAQKFVDETGDLSVLIGQTELNVEFNYSNLRLMKEEFTEEEYIQKHSAKLDEKTKGEGDYWKKKWNAAKETIWEPNFMQLLYKTATVKKGIQFTQENKSDNKYTLLVDALWIYPGWDAGIMKQPAKVTTLLKIVETADKNKVVYQVKAQNAPGDQWGNNYSNESRIGEGFEKTAKSFGQRIVKKLK